jgi:hypothetical protein
LEERSKGFPEPGGGIWTIQRKGGKDFEDSKNGFGAKAGRIPNSEEDGFGGKAGRIARTGEGGGILTISRKGGKDSGTWRIQRSSGDLENSEEAGLGVVRRDSESVERFRAMKLKSQLL